jgi:hypothetical protein
MVLHRLFRSSLVCLVGLICLSASGGKAAGSGDVEISIGSWHGNKTLLGGARVCLLSGPESNNVTLTAVRTERNDQFLIFYNRSWTLRKGATYDVVLTFDQGEHFSVKAEARRTEGVTISLPIGSAIERAFRSSNRMRLEAAKQTYSFTLRNSASVLDLLSECSSTERPSTKGPAPKEAPPKPETFPEPLPKPEQKGEAAPTTAESLRQEVRAVAEQVTLGAFLTNVTWAAPQEATPETTRWQAQEVNGDVSILTYGGQAPTPEQAAQSLITLTAAACEGTFNGKATPQKALEITLQVVSLHCKPLTSPGSLAAKRATIENADSVLYYIAPRPAGGAYIYRLTFKTPPPPNAEPLPGLYTALAISAHSATNTP